MYLDFLTISAYKNVAEAAMQLSPNLNCFTGHNGAGKTNILDAVHYLSLTRSAVGTIDSRCVNHQSDFFILKGRYSVGSDTSESITVSYNTRDKKKRVMRGAKEYERFSEHIGRFRVVMVSPSDSVLISDSPEGRRRFMDTFFSQLDGNYLSTLVRYNAALAGRNSLLKQGCYDAELMEVYTLQLCDLAQKICDARQQYVAELGPLVAQYYGVISGDKEVVEVTYKSKVLGGNLRELLHESLHRDSVLGYTTVGVHRDDLSLTMNSELIRAYGSQGQQKSLLLSLKLAEAKIIAHHTGQSPILLLDDIFDKLDISRVENLVGLVSGEDFGQIFLSDASKVRIASIVEKFSMGHKIFEVNGGNISEL